MHTQIISRDIQRPLWLYTKACLLLIAALLASTLLIIENPSIRTAALLTVAVWGFCRTYYFAFYVVERYVDPVYRFSGLFSFLSYAIQRRVATKPAPQSDSPTG